MPAPVPVCEAIGKSDKGGTKSIRKGARGVSVLEETGLGKEMKATSATVRVDQAGREGPDSVGQVGSVMWSSTAFPKCD